MSASFKYEPYRPQISHKQGALRADLFNTNLFQLLFSIPGLIFHVSNNSKFPREIPERYKKTFLISQDVPTSFDDQIVCLIDPANILIINFSINLTKNVVVWRMTIYENTERTFTRQYCWHMGPNNLYPKLKFSHNTIDLDRTIISDDDLLTENIYVIAEYFLGDNHRTIIDNSIYQTQRKYFVDKFLTTFLFIKNIDCFSVTKYSIIQNLINLEYREDNSHIMTF